MGSGRDGPHNCGWSDDCKACNEDRMKELQRQTEEAASRQKMERLQQQVQQRQAQRAEERTKVEAYRLKKLQELARLVEGGLETFTWPTLAAEGLRGKPPKKRARK